MQLLRKVVTSDKGIYIERKVPYIFDPNTLFLDGEGRYTFYWMALNDHHGKVVGVIGMQVDMSVYDRLIPSAVIEDPYSLSLISLYDKSMKRIWDWGCRGDDCDG